MGDVLYILYAFFTALLVVGPVIAAGIVAVKVFKFSKRSTPEIMEAFDRPDGWYWFPVACEVLRKRRQSLDFALPACIDLALSEKGPRELSGFWCLQMYFKTRMPPGVDWSHLPLSTDAREELVKLREELGA